MTRWTLLILPSNVLLCNILSNAVLEDYKGSMKKVMVGKGTIIQINQPHTLAESMSTHNHEEADTMIPVLVIDAIGDSTLRDIDVWSPDTDVLTLPMDLVAHGRLGTFTELTFITGKFDKYQSINIRERVNVTGRKKFQGLIGFHDLTGAVWGGTFVGISMKSWITSYLSLPNDDPIVSAFQLLREAMSWWTVTCPKKCGQSRSLFDQYTALRSQLPYQLCVGNCLC